MRLDIASGSTNQNNNNIDIVVTCFVKCFINVIYWYYYYC